MEEKQCLQTCHENQLEYNNICYNDNSNFSRFFQNNNIQIKNNTNINYILNNIILSNYLPENGNSILIQGNDDIVYQVTNSKNELELLKNMSNNALNMSIIDLGK